MIRVFCCALLAAAAVHAQGEWTTSHGDAQRSSWVRTDKKITPEALEKGGFEMLWKMKLGPAPSEPLLVNNIIGYRGFKALALVGSGSGQVFAVDDDLARMYWKKDFDQPRAAATALCPGGMTATPARLTPMAPIVRPGAFAAAAAAAAARPGRPLGSQVGAPGEGAAGLDEILAKISAPPPPAAARPAAPPAAPGAAQMAFGGVSAVYAISSDGVLHSLNVQNAADFDTPAPFLPANARVYGFTVINLVGYAATGQGCGGAPDAVWSIDLSTPARTISQWKPDGGNWGDPALAFGSDATVYVASGNGLAALEPKTLQLKSRSPKPAAAVTVFQFKGKDYIVAGSREGMTLYGSGGLDAPLDTAATPAEGLATFDEADGSRWIVASGAGKISAYTVSEKDGKLSLQSAWTTSNEMAGVQAPIVVNGVVFAAAGSTIYGFNANTGKAVWNSGRALGSPVRAGLSAGTGQLYATTTDGSLYAFGFPMEH